MPWQPIWLLPIECDPYFSHTSYVLRSPPIPSHTPLSDHPINLLKPTGYVMHHQFNIQQLYALPTLQQMDAYKIRNWLPNNYFTICRGYPYLDLFSTNRERLSILNTVSSYAKTIHLYVIRTPSFRHVRKRAESLWNYAVCCHSVNKHVTTPQPLSHSSQHLILKNSVTLMNHLNTALHWTNGTHTVYWVLHTNKCTNCITY
jgi:hypothetical protein